MKGLQSMAETAPVEHDYRAHALSLADLGYRVFRLEPLGKIPIEKNFPTIATNDPDTVRRWWTSADDRPANYNIGIATGKGVIAIDFDCKEGKPGLKAIEDYDVKGMPESGRTFTPTGGEHLLLKLPPSLLLGSSIEKLAAGVDTRCHNSYIVAPGSTVETATGAKAYEWQHKPVPYKDLAPVPDWFMPELQAKSSFKNRAKEASPAVDLDNDAAIDRAEYFLLHEADEAIEGANGDLTTFKVAARLKDFGLSEEVAYDLMLNSWNYEKALPPWEPELLEKKVASAYKSSQEQAGVSSPLADFHTHKIDGIKPGTIASGTPDEWPAPSRLMKLDPRDLPRREFIFDGMFAKRTVSALVAPSGAGKTQWLIQMAIAAATGRNDVIGFNPTKPTQKVWLWNQEDDRIELHRRLYAAAAAFDIDVTDIQDSVFFDSGVQHRLTLAAKDADNQLRATKHVPVIIERLKAMQIDVFIADPLVEFHQGEENDNVQMAAVASIYRRIAVEANCAVVIGHHDRKPDSASSAGHVGNQNAMRGASSLQGVTRAILTLYTMSDQDARDAGIPNDQKHFYLRLDGAKNNLALTGGKPSWLKRHGQPLYAPESIDDLDEPECVGVLLPQPHIDLNRITVERDMPPEEIEANRWSAVAEATRVLQGAVGTKQVQWQEVLDLIMSAGWWGDRGGVCPSATAWRRWFDKREKVGSTTVGGLIYVTTEVVDGGRVIVRTKGRRNYVSFIQSEDEPVGTGSVFD